MQARKIRSHLTKMGVAPPASGSAAASAASLAAASAASAPPASPSLAASAAEPDVCACFNVADLRRYKQLQRSEAELAAQQPGAKVAQATAHLAAVTRHSEASQAALPPLRRALDEARAKVRVQRACRTACAARFNFAAMRVRVWPLQPAHHVAGH